MIKVKVCWSKAKGSKAENPEKDNAVDKPKDTW